MIEGDDIKLTIKKVPVPGIFFMKHVKTLRIDPSTKFLMPVQPKECFIKERFKVGVAQADMDALTNTILTIVETGRKMAVEKLSRGLAIQKKLASNEALKLKYDHQKWVKYLIKKHFKVPIFFITFFCHRILLNIYIHSSLTL